MFFKSLIEKTPQLFGFTSMAVRGKKYAAVENMPGYLLPKQSRKTSFLTKSLKMKFFRLRRGKQGQRPRRPNYGFNDFNLSKMNI
ncbi:hypothetical protein EDD86DRAFT_207939 [Gorgonomyces haynaldii]|nr:hypothetical protein EDD86DRAFT_207939 [Gorgonomyces haynaldii]